MNTDVPLAPTSLTELSPFFSPILFHLQKKFTSPLTIWRTPRKCGDTKKCHTHPPSTGQRLSSNTWPITPDILLVSPFCFHTVLYAHPMERSWQSNCPCYRIKISTSAQSSCFAVLHITRLKIAQSAFSSLESSISSWTRNLSEEEVANCKLASLVINHSS